MDTNETNNNATGEIKSEETKTASMNMNLNQFKSTSNNFYAKVLYYLGWAIIILGVIGSVILASEAYSAVVAVFITGVLSSLFVGFLILGISEIINILDDNRKMLKEILNKDE